MLADDFLLSKPTLSRRFGQALVVIEDDDVAPSPRPVLGTGVFQSGLFPEYRVDAGEIGQSLEFHVTASVKTDISRAFG